MTADHRFAVRVKPGARRAEVGGRWDGRLGPALLVTVTAPAVDGRANDAVCRALAEVLGLRRRDIVVVTGGRSRDKLVSVADAPPDLAATIARLVGDPSDQR
ncbi:MAG TPA: DUF167 domain-containing protein [Pseudonocardiaceae bacterium]|nr:DUF167 domain-containing protein [Pseudonocardiaceae bacterium]